MFRNLEHDWKISDKDIWGKGWWINLSICARVIKIVAPKVTSVKVDFNNQVNRIICCIDRSQYLFSVTFVVSQWAHEQFVMVAGVWLCMGSATWTPTHKADLATAIVECPVC